MQKIVDKYNTIESSYLLPIIKNNGKDPRREYKNASHLINRKLKVIGQMLEIPVTLTTYVARHAWANIAKSKNLSLIHIFLIPTSLVAAELAAMFQDKQGGVFRWVGEAYGKKLGFLAIWVQWIESTIWYPTVLTFGAVSIAFKMCIRDSH